MQDEEQVQCLCCNRIDFISLAGHCVEHVEHVGAVVEVVARIDKRLTQRVLVRRCGDRRDLGNDAVREDLAVTRVIDVHRVVIEGRHRGHNRRHHRHRVGVVVKAIEESQQRLVDHRVMTNAVGEP